MTRRENSSSLITREAYRISKAPLCVRPTGNDAALSLQRLLESLALQAHFVTSALGFAV